MKKLMVTPKRKLVTVLILLMWLICPAQAQEQAYDIVTDLDPAKLSAFSWSADSRVFTFLNKELASTPLQIVSVQLPMPLWQSWDLPDGTVSTGQARWPLQPVVTNPNLAKLEQAQFLPASPDQRFFIYLRSAGETPVNAPGAAEVVLADNLTGEILPTNVFVRGAGFSPNEAHVAWAADSRSLALQTSASLMGDLQISSIQITSDSPFTAETYEFETMIDGSSYTAFDPMMRDRLWDISEDGDRVLLNGRPSVGVASTSYWQPRLILWSPLDPTANGLLKAFDAESICQAAFAPTSDSQIVALTNDGSMYLYDFVANTVLTLPVQNPEYCGGALSFSPDGHWLAVSSLSLERLAFVDIQRLIAQAVTSPKVPPVADAGEDIIVIESDDSNTVTVTLDSRNSFDPDGTIEEYWWGFEGAKVLSNIVETIELHLNIAGSRTYTLTVVDNDGLQDFDDVVVHINPSPNSPTVSITQPSLDSTTITSINDTRFQAEAHDPTVGTTNGDGIQQVDFELYNTTNHTLDYTFSDTSVPYCVFGSETTCNTGEAELITAGDYVLRASAQAIAGKQTEWVSRTFVLDLATGGK